MNLGQLEVALRVKIGGPSITDVPNTDLDGHINSAYQEIFDKYKFRRRRANALFTTAIGTDKYEVDTLTDVIYKAWDRTNGRPLTYIGKTKQSQRDFDMTPYPLVQSGKPKAWTYTEQYFQLFPPPDGLYDIEFLYKVIFSPLVLGTDVPIIPTSWHRGIYVLAAAIYYEDEGDDPEKAVYNRTQFKVWASDKPVEEHEQTEAIDSGVQIPTLTRFGHQTYRRPRGAGFDE